MAEPFQAIAVDIGASNGRAILGTLKEDGALETREVRRFPNGSTEIDGALRWDFEGLVGEVTGAIDDCFKEGARPASVGIDTWGVDYAYLDENGALIDRPYAYRDHRTDGLPERFYSEVMSAADVYAITGIQTMPLNTLFQIYADVLATPERLAKAGRLLMMPDALACALTGNQVSEYTIASTSQMLDAKTRKWSPEIASKVGIDLKLLPEIVEPGTKVGRYKARGGELDVVGQACHDTAAAVAAIPAEGDRPWAYVSSGTWTLVGVESKTPVLTEDARAIGLTNEGGVDGTYRLLSNITGLWIIQECMRMWEKRGEKTDIVEVCRAAAACAEATCLLDPDHPSFLSPDDMLVAIDEYCASTGQKPPEGVGEIARSVFVSLACKTRHKLANIARVTGTAPEIIHMVGGGTKNEMLTQFTADVTGMPIVAGPAEATATGNLLMQAMSAGRIASLGELRAVVRRNTDLKRYEPSGEAAWAKTYERFVGIVEAGAK